MISSPDPAETDIRALEAEFLSTLGRLSSQAKVLEGVQLDPDVRLQLLELLTKDAANQRR